MWAGRSVSHHATSCRPLHDFCAGGTYILGVPSLGNDVPALPSADQVSAMLGLIDYVRAARGPLGALARSPVLASSASIKGRRHRALRRLQPHGLRSVRNGGLRTGRLLDPQHDICDRREPRAGRAPISKVGRRWWPACASPAAIAPSPSRDDHFERRRLSCAEGDDCAARARALISFTSLPGRMQRDSSLVRLTEGEMPRC